MARLVHWLDRRFYPTYADGWDDDLFRARILEVLGPNSRVLDLGAGSGRMPQMDFRSAALRVCGIDPNERVLSNPFLDEAKVARGEQIPYEDASFDVVFADNVLEHLEEPAAVFREVARVLVPGGLLLAKTPNRRHYVPLIARATPHRFHEWVNRRRGRPAADTFPTLYRANGRRAIVRAAKAAGLSVVSLTFHEGRPEYLRFSALPYLFGLAYERLVNAAHALDSFRVVIVAVLRKPERAESGS